MVSCSVTERSVAQHSAMQRSAIQCSAAHCYLPLFRGESGGAAQRCARVCNAMICDGMIWGPEKEGGGRCTTGGKTDKPPHRPRTPTHKWARNSTTNEKKRKVRRQATSPKDRKNRVEGCCAAIARPSAQIAVAPPGGHRPRRDAMCAHDEQRASAKPGGLHGRRWARRPAAASQARTSPRRHFRTSARTPEPLEVFQAIGPRAAEDALVVTLEPPVNVQTTQTSPHQSPAGGSPDAGTAVHDPLCARRITMRGKAAGPSARAHRARRRLDTSTFADRGADGRRAACFPPLPETSRGRPAQELCRRRGKDQRDCRIVPRAPLVQEANRVVAHSATERRPIKAWSPATKSLQSVLLKLSGRVPPGPSAQSPSFGSNASNAELKDSGKGWPSSTQDLMHERSRSTTHSPPHRQAPWPLAAALDRDRRQPPELLGQALRERAVVALALADTSLRRSKAFAMSARSVTARPSVSTTCWTLPLVRRARRLREVYGEHGP